MHIQTTCLVNADQASKGVQAARKPAPQDRGKGAEPKAAKIKGAEPDDDFRIYPV
jgi:hypothetical protein